VEAVIFLALAPFDKTLAKTGFQMVFYFSRSI
jgi:hypothetical protein